MKEKHWMITILHACIGAPINYRTQVINEHPAYFMVKLRNSQAVTESFHLIHAIEIPALTMKDIEKVL